MIPQQRIRDKVDEYMSRADYPAVERHLSYWREEARQTGDDRGLLMVCNELVGHYRKTQEEAKCRAAAEEALALLKTIDVEQSVSAGTTYVNIATALQSFGKHEEALPLFEKALPLYENAAGTSKELLGGLYNNMALTLVSLKDYERAFSLYNKAMAAREGDTFGELDQASTLLNMADAYTDMWGMEAAEQKVDELLAEAWKKLHEPQTEHGGYYAYVCEKCASVYAYYGYFLQAAALEQAAKEIYERD